MTQFNWRLNAKTRRTHNKQAAATSFIATLESHTFHLNLRTNQRQLPVRSFVCSKRCSVTCLKWLYLTHSVLCGVWDDHWNVQTSHTRRVELWAPGAKKTWEQGKESKKWWTSQTANNGWCRARRRKKEEKSTKSSSTFLYRFFWWPCFVVGVWMGRLIRKWENYITLKKITLLYFGCTLRLELGKINLHRHNKT